MLKEALLCNLPARWSQNCFHQGPMQLPAGTSTSHGYQALVRVCFKFASQEQVATSQQAFYWTTQNPALCNSFFFFYSFFFSFVYAFKERIHFLLFSLISEHFFPLSVNASFLSLETRSPTAPASSQTDAMLQFLPLKKSSSNRKQRNPQFIAHLITFFSNITYSNSHLLFTFWCATNVFV